MYKEFSQQQETLLREKAEEARKESEKKYRTLVESRARTVAWARADSSCGFGDSAMETISGYSVQELASLTFQQVLGLVHPDDKNFSLHDSMSVCKESLLKKDTRFVK